MTVSRAYTLADRASIGSEAERSWSKAAGNGAIDITPVRAATIW
jgi:hypothetical protein